MKECYGRHYLPGQTAANSVHVAEVICRELVAGSGRTFEPARGSRVVGRRPAHPLVEQDPEV